MIDRLRTDLVSVVRLLRLSPGIPVAAVITVAIAVGINLAMFGLIDRALLSPPAHIAEPQRVFTVAFQYPSPGGEPALGGTTSYPVFESMRGAIPGIEATAAWHPMQASADVDQERIPVRAMAVSGDYFPMLEARPRLGRILTPDDDRAPTGSAVVVLSHALWKRAFGGAEDVVGRIISLSQSEHGELRVVGVMPAGFSGHSADRVDLWVPLRAARIHLPGWQHKRSLAIVGVV